LTLDIYKYLKRLSNSGLTSKNVKAYLLDKYYKIMTKLKLNQIGIDARKEWLINNSRCSEVLDSEFYYQMFPSLDMVLFDIDK
jgi:hypothetical protein